MMPKGVERHEQAFSTLEYDRMRALVRRGAQTPMGRARADALAPLSRLDAVRRALQTVSECVELRRRGGGWSFSELSDPEDQATRFRTQAAAREAGDEEAMYYDADYIRAMEYGLPPTAGEGIGVDRLVMLFTNSATIRDVILFPQLKREA